MENPQLAVSPDVPAKLTDWTNEPTLQTLQSDFEQAKPAHDEQDSRIHHWENLRTVSGNAKPSKIKGRSSVQPKLIRRQNEWRYSALSEPFLGSQKLFKVSPVSFEDEAAARQNELVLNWQFRTKLNKVKLIDDFVRATVDEGTCIVRLGWKRSTTMIVEQAPVFSFYQPQSQEQLDMLTQALELKLTNPREFNEQASEEIKAAVNYYEENGEATVAMLTGYEPTEVEKVLENRPTVEIMNPTNVYIDPSCQGDIDKALFVVVSFETNKADLEKEKGKYKNLDQIIWNDSSPLSQPDHATNTPDSFNFADEARKKVVAYEYWGYYDIHNNGELTAFVATWIGRVLIRMELNPFPDQKLPFVVVPYSPVKRNLYGEPDAELLEDNQRVLGAVTRGMIDLMGRSANSQQGFAKGMLDPLNRRRFENGENYEYNPGQHPQQGFVEHKYPEIPQSAIVMLNLQNQEAEALTGVKSFSGGMSGSAYGDVATGIRGVLDAASKREMSILRRLAKGMTDIGNKIIAMNAEFLSEEEVVRVTNGEFVTILREDLQGNFDLEVDISTAEVDNSKAQDLGFLLQTIGPNTDPSIFMLILADIAELKRMPVLAHKLRTWKPTPDPLVEQMKQLELQEKQMQVQKLESEILLNQAKAKEVIATGNQKELDSAEQSSGIKHERAMEQHQAQAEGNENLEVTKALLTPPKEGEGRPNIDAAIGYKQLSKALKQGSKPNLIGFADSPVRPQPSFL